MGDRRRARSHRFVCAPRRAHPTSRATWSGTTLALPRASPRRSPSFGHVAPRPSRSRALAMLVWRSSRRRGRPRDGDEFAKSRGRYRLACQPCRVDPQPGAPTDPSETADPVCAGEGDGPARRALRQHLPQRPQRARGPPSTRVAAPARHQRPDHRSEPHRRRSVASASSPSARTHPPERRTVEPVRVGGATDEPSR